MRTAIDTSVLLAILKGERDGRAWLELLMRCRSEGGLVTCEVVVAELAAGIASRPALEQALDDLGLSFDSLSLESAHVAGQAFAAYRREGGPREHLIPDFLIGAHAMVQADRLAARDRGYLRPSGCASATPSRATIVRRQECSRPCRPGCHRHTP